MPNNISFHVIERVLEIMSDGRSFYPRKLARDASIHRGTAKKVLKLLHERGFAEVSNNSCKPYFYRITPRGRELLSLLKAGREGRRNLAELDPPPDRLSEEFKEKIWRDWGIDVDLVDGGEDADA